MLLDLLVSRRISALFLNPLSKEVHSELHRVVLKKLLALLAAQIAHAGHLRLRIVVSSLVLF